MKAQSTNKSWWNRAGSTLWPILLAVLFFTFTFSYYPFREKLQFDTDEGLNLMRSMLVSLGYPLYSQVSSDQPPLFTHILALVFRLGDSNVYQARVLVLLFSTLLVWASAQFVQIASGKLAATLFLPIIVLVPRYLNLSVAVMIGVPAISLAVVSLLLVAVWHQRRNNVWLVLSGFMLALSTLIKLFTGFVAPILVAGIILASYFDGNERKLSWKTLRPAALWSVSFVGLGAVLGIALIGFSNLWSIILPPLMAPSQDQFQMDVFAMNTHLLPAIPLLILGFLGAGIAIYRRRWLVLYTLAWVLLAYAMFSFYSPVFYHHQLLITVPVAMMAAVGMGEGIAGLLSVRKPSDFAKVPMLSGLVLLAVFAWVSRTYMPVLDKELREKPDMGAPELAATAGKLRVLNAMHDYIDQTHWIVTDVPMFAFRVGRPVPPVLATFSSKRLATGSLTEADIMAVMEEYQPEQVLMARFVIPPLEEYLKEHYTLILSPEFYRLFIRNDIVSPN